MNQLPVILLSLNLTVFGYQQDSLRAKDSTYSQPSHHTMSITKVLEKHTDKWMEIPGVVGTGEGKSDGKPCIMIFLSQKSDTVQKKIPNEVDGYKVVFEVTGEIKAN